MAFCQKTGWNVRGHIVRWCFTDCGVGRRANKLFGCHFPEVRPRCGKAFYVHADRTRVKQVMINLLSNAIKYNQSGGSVKVECTRHADRVRASVTDSGAGLNAEQMSQLFQPFNRLGQESSTEEGTGIGLVVTKQLVELMGGTIGVDSTVGVGTTFWVEFKASRAPELHLEQGKCCPWCRKTRKASAPCCTWKTIPPTWRWWSN